MNDDGEFRGPQNPYPEDDYPPGSLGFERARLLEEARAVFAALPWYRRWAFRRALKRVESLDRQLGELISRRQESVVAEILAWREDDSRGRDSAGLGPRNSP